MKREKTSLPNTEFTVATGNYDESRVAIDRIVLHTVVGSAQSAITTFGTKGKQVSAHYIVDLDGKLYHGLEEYFTAYHSGSYSMNQRSIGIEHADNGDYNGVRPNALYESSAKLVADICKFYGIPCDAQHILRHHDVPGASTACPDALDTNRIIARAQALLMPSPPPPPVDPCANVKADLANAQKQVADLTAKNTQLQSGIDSANKQVADLKSRLDKIKALASY